MHRNGVLGNLNGGALSLKMCILFFPLCNKYITDQNCESNSPSANLNLTLT